MLKRCITVPSGKLSHWRRLLARGGHFKLIYAFSNIVEASHNTAFWTIYDILSHVWHLVFWTVLILLDWCSLPSFLRADITLSRLQVFLRCYHIFLRNSHQIVERHVLLLLCCVKFFIFIVNLSILIYACGTIENVFWFLLTSRSFLLRLILLYQYLPILHDTWHIMIHYFPVRNWAPVLLIHLVHLFANNAHSDIQFIDGILLRLRCSCKHTKTYKYWSLRVWCQYDALTLCPGLVIYLILLFH